MSDKLNVLLVDDHDLVLEGLSLLFTGIDSIGKVGIANNFSSALDLAKDQSFDFAFLDISLGDQDGRELFKLLKSILPALKCIALSSHSESSIIRTTMHLGFDGYLLKSDDAAEIETAIHAILTGKKYISAGAQYEIIQDHMVKKTPSLSQREIEILGLIADEKSTKEMAELLFLSTKTIENHRMSLMQKLEVSNVAGLIRKGIKYGYIDV